MNQSILVSGGTGLLGSHLLVQLAREGQKVKAFYRNEKGISEVKQLFKFYKIEEKWGLINWIQVDISDIDSVIENSESISKIYHCAALVSFNPDDSEKLFEANVVGTRNMVNVALQLNVKKFVYVSSTAAIGRSGLGHIITEETKWVASPENTFYAKSKHMAEQEVWRGIEEGLDAVMINPCVIIGPGSLEKSTGTMFSQVISGLKFYTKGANAFVDVRDVVDVMLKLSNSNITAERFLVIGENLSFKTIFSLVAENMNLQAPTIHASKFMTDIAWRLEKLKSVITRKPARITIETARASHRVSEYSNQKIKDALDIEFRSVESAVKNTVEFLDFTNQI